MLSYLLTCFFVLLRFHAIDSEISNGEGTCSTDYPVNVPEVSKLKYKGAHSFKLEGFDNATVVLRKSAEDYNMDLEGELYVTGGGLKNKYKAVRITMLMDNSTIHLYNKRQFVMQVYILSYNTKYANFTEAKGKADGLSAISFWVQETQTNTETSLVPTFESLFLKGGEKTEAVKLRNIFPQYLRKFFQYHGKLGPTHPSCDVAWSIVHHRLLLHKDQVYSSEKEDLKRGELLQIQSRLKYLESLVENTKYSRQKRMLGKELANFLSEFGRGNLGQATPDDIVSFLVYKDKKGKTKVHSIDCEHLGESDADCPCPKRLAVGSVKTILGKLASIFDKQIGRRGKYDEFAGMGNPVDSDVVSKYVKAVQEEQAVAHVEQRQAIPMFLGKLELISEYILACLDHMELRISETFILKRDRAFFLLQYFAGDRASDLGKVLAQEVRDLPDGGYLFRHSVGKTLGNGRVNTFAVKTVNNPIVCPVKAIREYVTEAGKMGVDLRTGYLFRPVDRARTSVLSDCPLSYSVVYERLKVYLRHLNIDAGETPHSLRRGCAITLSLSGAASQAADVMGHVGWFSNKSLDRYTELARIVDSCSVSSLFANISMSADKAEGMYKAVGTTAQLPKAF